MIGSARRALKKFLEPKNIWSMALFVLDAPFDPATRLGTPVKVFDTKALRWTSGIPYTRADPFMHVVGDWLYILYEVVCPGGFGQIAAYRTADLATYEDLGVVFTNGAHLSFPLCFDHGGETYLVPESLKSNAVSLYRFDAFPRGVEKVRDLVAGRWCDSFLLLQDDVWYLFSTIDGALHVFYSDNLLTGEFHPHPLNPVCVDKLFSRSGGRPLAIDGKTYRVAQDCSGAYGRNVNLVEIAELSPTAYREAVAFRDIVPLDKTWNGQGSHQIEVAFFKGKWIVMTDGQQPDYFVNRFLAPLNRLF